MDFSMPKNRISPHDRYIRSMLSHPKVMEEFMQANLPAKIKDSIDFRSIELQKESFIDDKLRLKIADLLYGVKFDGKPGYIYILLEHASKPDRFLPFRMLKYMVAIMDHHVTKTENKELPVIYPLILYTGNQPFTHSLDLFDLFGKQKALVKDILKNPYHLIDLTQSSDEDLRKHLWFGTVASIAKHIHDKNFLSFLEVILKELKIIAEKGETGYIYTVISYIVEVAEISDKQRFMKMLTAGLESVDEEKIMTILEQFKPELEERARQRALAEATAFIEQSKLELYNKAKQEALHEALRNVALNLIRLQKSVEEIADATGLSKQDVEALKNKIN
jgi:predicted transposase/invertase (TIGR01784 family)